MKRIASPNFSERKKSSKIDTIIIHHTEMVGSQAAIERLCDPEIEVSAHYVIDKDGTIFQLVDEKKKAWHAGISFWRNREGLNEHSIGIELDNIGTEPFPEPQMDSLISLCHEIMKRHPIEQHNVIAHYDIASDRKDDPNEHFDWARLADNGIGIYPKVVIDTPILLYKQGDESDEITDLREKLKIYGYKLELSNKYDKELSTVIVAFKRHFSVETFDLPGWDSLADARLNELLKSI